MEQFDIETDNGESTPLPPPKKYIGLILDVEVDKLDKLLKFDNQKSFLTSFFKDLDAEVITLITGNNYIPYFQLDKFLQLSNDSLNNYVKNNASIFDTFSNTLFQRKKISDIINQGNISKKMAENNKPFQLIDSELMDNNISNLKNVISNSFSTFSQNIFESLNGYISKSSSIYSSLNKIFELFNDSVNNSKFKYIIIISDGIIKENSYELRNLISKAKKNNIIVITIVLTKDKNIKRKIFYDEFPEHLNKNLKNLFDISSKVDYNNPFARQFIKKNWDFPKEGQGTLLFEANIEDMNNPNYFVNDFKKTQNEEYEIKIDQVNLKNIIHFKFKFNTKNQIFGTCWANAYSEAIILANKRILGRKIETFETYRENIIKNACLRNEDGGHIEFQNVYDYFRKQKLRIEKISEEEAKSVLMKGRFVVCHFYLNDLQWHNFSKFYRDHKDEVLTEEIINEKMNPLIREVGGHAVLLVEFSSDYLKFLNSWGSNWADNGTFKVKNADVLASYYTDHRATFYDIFYYEEDLSPNEKTYYSKNITYIRKILDNLGEITINKIINHINELSNNFYKCKKCFEKMKPDYFVPFIENGLHKVKCIRCAASSKAEGKLKELLILKDLMHDGSKNFDINYEEKDYIHIERVEFHKQLEIIS